MVIALPVVSVNLRRGETTTGLKTIEENPIYNIIEADVHPFLH